jgi:hypothetical protein
MHPFPDAGLPSALILSKELNYVKARLFLVLKKNKLVIYILKLLVDIKIYSRFYINLLELANKDTLL